MEKQKIFEKEFSINTTSDSQSITRMQNNMSFVLKRISLITITITGLILCEAKDPVHYTVTFHDRESFNDFNPQKSGQHFVSEIPRQSRVVLTFDSETEVEKFAQSNPTVRSVKPSEYIHTKNRTCRMILFALPLGFDDSPDKFGEQIDLVLKSRLQFQNVLTSLPSLNPEIYFTQLL